MDQRSIFADIGAHVEYDRRFDAFQDRPYKVGHDPLFAARLNQPAATIIHREDRKVMQTAPQRFQPHILRALTKENLLEQTAYTALSLFHWICNRPHFDRERLATS